MVTKGKWACAAALALAALAGPGQAQSPPENVNISEQELATDKAQAPVGKAPVRLLAGMDEAQILAFFDRLIADRELQAIVAPVSDANFEPGEAVAGWRESGINVRAETGTSGGLSGKVLVVDEPRLWQIVDLSGTASPDLTGFTSLRLRAAPPGGANEMGYLSFVPGLWIALETHHIERGNALCYTGLIGIELFSRFPLTELDENTIYTVAAIAANFDQMAAREYCVVYDRKGDTYRGRSFLPDGRTLPQMDTDTDWIGTMPVAELSAFMRDAVPVPLAK
jgi:hypothetical protein